MACKSDPIIERRIKGCTSAEEFWTLLLEVVPLNSRAYLGSILKQGNMLLRQGRLTLPDIRLQRFCMQGSDIDTLKIIDFLLAHPSTATYYELFLIMQHRNDNRTLLYRCCQSLLSTGNDLSYNMAAAVSHYFDLQLPATFSLRLEPYELSRLDEGYETFCKILLRQ